MRGENLMRQIVFARGGERAVHQHAVGPADFGDAGDRQKLAAARTFELAPQRIGALHQRHVGRMLEIALPDDAGAAMRGTALMAGLETLEPEHAQLAAGEMAERGAPHRSQPDHDRVVSQDRLLPNGTLFRIRIRVIAAPCRIRRRLAQLRRCIALATTVPHKCLNRRKHPHRASPVIRHSAVLPLPAMP